MCVNLYTTQQSKCLTFIYVSPGSEGNSSGVYKPPWTLVIIIAEVDDTLYFFRRLSIPEIVKYKYLVKKNDILNKFIV